jgi:hypothetical protein
MGCDEAAAFVFFFWFSEKIVGECSIFVLAFRDRTIIVASSRSTKGRVAIVFVTWQRGANGRYDAGP